jgi:hypothetical protein
MLLSVLLQLPLLCLSTICLADSTVSCMTATDASFFLILPAKCSISRLYWASNDFSFDKKCRFTFCHPDSTASATSGDVPPAAAALLLRVRKFKFNWEEDCDTDTVLGECDIDIVWANLAVLSVWRVSMR